MIVHTPSLRWPSIHCIFALINHSQHLHIVYPGLPEDRLQGSNIFRPAKLDMGMVRRELVIRRGSLKGLGALLLERLAEVMTSSLFYGIFMLLFFLSVFSSLRQPVKSYATWGMLGATIVSFLLATLYWVACVAGMGTCIRETLIDGINTTLDSAWLDIIEPRLFKVDQVSNWTMQAILVLNDIIIAWRAWVICSTEHLWLMLSPLFLLMGTFTTSLAFLGLTFNVDEYAAYRSGHQVTVGLVYSAGALSLATNVCSTSLIAYRLWSFRTAWNIGYSSRWSQVQRMLLMMVESGAIYGVLQVATMFTVTKTSNESNTARSYFKTVVWMAYIHTPRRCIQRSSCSFSNRSVRSRIWTVLLPRRPSMQSTFETVNLG